MDTEATMLNEISQTKKYQYYMISLICELYMESKKSKCGVEPESSMGLPGVKGRGVFEGIMEILVKRYKNF